MRCSRCSEVIKPVVALDIDGTLADYHAHFIGFAAGWLGRGFITSQLYHGVEPFRDWFCRAFEVDITTFRRIKLAYRQGGQKRLLAVYEGARALAAAAHEIAELWVVTNRPHDRYDRVDPDTVEWLRRNEIRYHGLLYSDHKMEALAERVDPNRVCFVLDDLIHVLEAADVLFPKASIVLRRTSWNADDLWPVATGDLYDARAMMTVNVQDWNLAHHFDELPTMNEGE